MRPLHDRMPLVLEPADWPLWLGEVAGDPAALLKPAHDDVLRAWPVSRAVNNVKNDGAELLAPIAGAPDPTRQGKSSI
jgi:putative SOS response-associated peptidase YedK